ncbi:MAG: DUF2911 domain-containing protein [Bacteroidetes bacterium]|nr:DUF2911 domain-containing protein [Bacteroidota bacterium]
MKIFFSSLILVGLLSACSNTKTKEEGKEATSQIVPPKEENIRVISVQTETDTLKGSLKAKAMGTIGNAGVTINYYSPAVRGRVIWGGLVPFDNVWVTGAHRATSVEFNLDVVIGGVTIAAGKYALFTIPGKKEWTIIINKNWEQHLADNYDSKEDVVRVKVKPETEETNQERLRYVVESENNASGEIAIYWEKLEVSLPVKAAQ